MKSYCVREKRKTECVPGTEELVMMRNGREAVRCICASCGAKKFSIIPTTMSAETIAMDSLVSRRPRAPKRKTRKLEPKFDYKRTWERILDDDKTMRKFPEKVFEDDIIMQKIPIDNSRFRELMRKPQNQWQKILADDYLMGVRKRRSTADDRFNKLMKQYKIDRDTKRAMKRSVGPRMTKKQMEAIAKANLIELNKAKATKEFLKNKKRIANERAYWKRQEMFTKEEAQKRALREEIADYMKMFRNAMASNAPHGELKMIGDEINQLKRQLENVPLYMD